MNRKYICANFVVLMCIFTCHANLDFLEDFKSFIVKFKRVYQPDDGEYGERYRNYKESHKIQQWLYKSQPVLSASYGETKFSDLSSQEFQDIYLSDMKVMPIRLKQNYSTPLNRLEYLNIPEKLDWRTYLNYSIVSAVKNQRACGACWAFSTVETIESMYAKKTRSGPLDLSVQEVIDCSQYNSGCKGGDTCMAMQWMVDAKAPIVTDSVYPLTDMSNECMMITNQTKGVRIFVKNYTCLNLAGREDETLKLLQNGPVSAVVDATTWKNYQGGIIQYHCEAFVNHAVQIVGYDLTGEVPYYIVRNSWGNDFGHDGYLYIKIGDNVCGIAHGISSVDVYT